MVLLVTEMPSDCFTTMHANHLFYLLHTTEFDITYVLVKCYKQNLPINKLCDMSARIHNTHCTEAHISITVQILVSPISVV